MSAEGEGPRPSAPLPRLLGAGARGARAVAGAAGLDEAVERTTEEAIVRALESPAVERAIVRVLESDEAQAALERALESPAVERAVIGALDSQLVDRAWRHILASDEAQQLVERIAEAPEVRAALTSQGVGLVTDIGRGVREVSDHVDELIDAIVSRLRGRRAPAPGPPRVGLATRAVAAAVDGVILNLIFLGVSALFGVTIGGVIGDDASPSGSAVAIGATLWSGAGALYLTTFWALAGQTPGMRFLSIRLDSPHGRRIGTARAVKRLLGTVLSVLSFGLGFAIAVLDPRRRTLADRLAGTEVFEADRTAVAPWSRPPRGTSGEPAATSPARG
jgi:uncharacterized RDD family membrane protein YckC